MKKQIDYKFKANEINKVLHKLDGKKFKNIMLEFDFENSTLMIDNKKRLKVERDSEFTYKFMKTKVKAINGIDGLYKHIKEASEPGSFWNNRIYTILMNVINPN